MLKSQPFQVSGCSQESLCHPPGGMKDGVAGEKQGFTMGIRFFAMAILSFLLTISYQDLQAQCSNVTDPGEIVGNEANCGSWDPAPIGNLVYPSGGSGTIEYMWLSSTTGCPSNVSQAIPGATGPTYDPGFITQTTWYVRCSRRVGCSWTVDGESNCIKKEVDNSCPPSGGGVCTTPEVLVEWTLGNCLVSYSSYNQFTPCLSKYWRLFKCKCFYFLQ